MAIYFIFPRTFRILFVYLLFKKRKFYIIFLYFQFIRKMRFDKILVIWIKFIIQEKLEIPSSIIIYQNTVRKFLKCILNYDN